RELTTEEWFTIIKKAFDAGIPHLLFTGGEPTTREDLPELLEYAETLGLVTGLLSDGLKLAKKSYRSLLINKGLDHLMMIVDVNNEESWKTLQAILDEDLFTTAHLTMEPKQDLKPFIDRLAKMKVNAISLSTSDPSFAETLQTLRDYVALQQIELVWDMPVPYSRWNPVSLELANTEIPQGAGSAWLYIEPDGDVLPAQGVNHIFGNLLKDPWVNIWNNRPRE
ncbi:MAG: radical SAM protein, partial [Chloroflexota bacterium]